MRNQQRQGLQETSKNRVKNWSNTMEAQRVKREEDRIKRLEDAEVSRDDKMEQIEADFHNSVSCTE